MATQFQGIESLLPVWINYKHYLIHFELHKTVNSIHKACACIQPFFL